MAIELNASGEYLEATGLGSQFAISSSTASTVAAWARWQTTGFGTSNFSNALFFHGTSSWTDGWGLHCHNGSGTLRVILYTNGGNSGAQNTSIAADTWFHIAAYFDQANNDIEIFINGTSLYSNTSYTDNSNGQDNLHIGWDEGTTAKNWRGQIAEFGYWPNTKLTTEQITTLASGFSPTLVAPQGLKLYTPLVKNSIDIYGNSLTENGSVAFVDHPFVINPENLNIGITGTSGTAFNQSITGLFVPSGANVFQTQKITSGSFVSGSSISKETQTGKTGTILPDGALIDNIQKILSGGFTPTSVLASVKTALISLAGNISPSGGIVNETQKAFNGVITPIGSLAKEIQKLLLGSVTPTSTIEAVKTVLISLTGGIAPSGILINEIKKVTNGIMNISGSLIKQINTFLSGSLGLSGVLAAIKTVLINLSGAIVPTSNLVFEIRKVVTGVITPISTISKLTSKIIAGILGIAGALSRVFSGDDIDFRGKAIITISVINKATITDSAINDATITTTNIGNATITDSIKD